VEGKPWNAVANVGFRPTFESKPVAPRVEAHLLDFLEPIYGKQIELDFLARVRDEQRFPNVDALIKQIHLDIQTTREFFANREKLSEAGSSSGTRSGVGFQSKAPKSGRSQE
jgi:riboflavin kinase/FMN adenylyltransferase